MGSESSRDSFDSSQQQQSLLEKGDSPAWRKQKRWDWKFFLNMAAIQLLLLAINTAIIVTVTRPGTCSAYDDLPWTPAQPALRYERKVIDRNGYGGSPYAGNPSREIDLAWNELTSGFNLRVSGQDLERINKSSIPLSDGSGYIAGTDTTHQLHCLLSIRHALAPEYYAEEIATMYIPPGDVYPAHLAHCIETLRQFVLCKADGALFTYAWAEDQHAPLTDFAVEHSCVNWESLQDWSRDNSFNIQDNLLVHPKFGKWPDGEPV